MDKATANALDREEAMRLIHRFAKLYFDNLMVRTQIQIKNGNKMDVSMPFRELGVPEPEIQPAILSYYFGGNPRKWGAILKGSAAPSKLDLACLRRVVSAKSLNDVRIESRHLREAAKGGDLPRWIVASVPDAKKPIHRRDGATYDRDVWQKVNKEMDKIFKNGNTITTK